MPITAFPGKNLKGIMYPITFIKAISKARSVIKKEKIDAVICTGAYISYPPGLAARRLRKKLFLMESNVNPGKSILWLSTNATKVYTSYEKSSEFFDPISVFKLNCLGNPVRDEILNPPTKEAAIKSYNFNPEFKTIFIFGGSLGARSINLAVEKNLNEFAKMNVNIIWQTGKNYVIPPVIPSNIIATEFIDDMATAYSASDLVVARSGATTVAEVAVLAKPSILVPLPSASNNEQYENARMLDEGNAAILINDDKIQDSLLSTIQQLIENETELISMSERIKEFARPNAVREIAEDIMNTMTS
jgi:UDP-N-acetylglucosamine--N-acetylmuramyl-(pentapeptide) pyrophosphoryl-undecaprenol N-acetylglucosamine transferase